LTISGIEVDEDYFHHITNVMANSLCNTQGMIGKKDVKTVLDNWTLIVPLMTNNLNADVSMEELRMKLDMLDIKGKITQPIIDYMVELANLLLYNSRWPGAKFERPRFHSVFRDELCRILDVKHVLEDKFVYGISSSSGNL
jgi:hypothetical protein